MSFYLTDGNPFDAVEKPVRFRSVGEIEPRLAARRGAGRQWRQRDGPSAIITGTAAFGEPGLGILTGIVALPPLSVCRGPLFA